MEALIANLIVSFTFLIVGGYWKKFPPKNINYLYGYRTKRSMANQRVWKYANALGAHMFLVLGTALTVLVFVTFAIFPKHAVLTNLALMLIGIGVGMFWCEKKLNQVFDKDGNPKK